MKQTVTPGAPLIVDAHSDIILPTLGRSLMPGETEPRNFFDGFDPAAWRASCAAARSVPALGSQRHASAMPRPIGAKRRAEALPRPIGAKRQSGHANLARLIEGGVSVQAMALFLDDPFLALGARKEAFAVLDALEGLYEASGGAFFPYREPADAEKARDEGRVAGMLTIEGGEAIEGDLGTLRDFAAHGLKIFGLTWNRRNELGRGVRAEGSDGLTELGRRAVAECEKLGVLVDASHLSDAAFDDLAACAERPFVATHSNCRALCSNLRNLDDARIEAIAASGGVIGITFVSYFVVEQPGASTIANLLAQVDHAVSVAGIEHVGFGSDFEGYPTAPGDFMLGAESWPALVDALRDHGYSEAEVGALAGGNWLRVLAGS